MALTAEQVKQVLEGIANRNGGILLPEHVVRAAQSDDHPLHDRFEWDDEVAAHAHRIEQARNLIRSVRVEMRVNERTVTSVYYVHRPDAPAGEPGYIPLPRAISDEEMALAVVSQEFQRALSSLERAREIGMALGIGDSVADLAERLRQLAALVPAPPAKAA